MKAEFDQIQLESADLNRDFALSQEKIKLLSL